jgi:glycerol kinase
VTVLVIDAGTSSVRVARVVDGRVVDERRQATPPSSPAPGLVEFDPEGLAGVVVDLATQAIEAWGAVDAVGIANQRASTIVWDRATGDPVGPGLGWQDLRTIGECLSLAADGIRLAPNHTATKAAWLWDQVDPDRGRDLCVGTVDAWLAWRLTAGAVHVTDATNASTTGLLAHDGSGWDDDVLAALRLDRRALPGIVDSAAVVGEAAVLPGRPRIAGIAGDQQASLVGQRCTQPGQAKITFGTGGMLDVVIGPQRPSFAVRGGAGTFPLVAWRLGGEVTWGVEAIMLSAGSNVDWLRDDLGLLESAPSSHDVAASCGDTGGVRYVPALLGMGTPHWDYGARGTLLGLTRGTGRAEVVRAVLEGVAHRGADLVEAAEADTGVSIDVLRIDGGMSSNPTFVQALADAAQRPVQLSPELEATAAGAGLLAELGTGARVDLESAADGWEPTATIEPAGPARRDEWHAAVDRAKAWYPDLTAIDF